MKTTKAGIIMYENSDPLPSAKHFTDQLAMMINMLRTEINKMAVIIDKQQEEIDQLKKQLRT